MIYRVLSGVMQLLACQRCIQYFVGVTDNNNQGSVSGVRA